MPQPRITMIARRSLLQKSAVGRPSGIGEMREQRRRQIVRVEIEFDRRMGRKARVEHRVFITAIPQARTVRFRERTGQASGSADARAAATHTRPSRAARRLSTDTAARYAVSLCAST